MKRTHLIAVLVGIVAVGIFAADASAMYHPGMGVFMSRDPGAGGAMRIGAGGPAVAGGFIPRDPTLMHGRVGSSNRSVATEAGSCPLTQLLASQGNSCPAGGCDRSQLARRGSTRATNLRHGSVLTASIPSGVNMAGHHFPSQENWQAGPLESMGPLVPSARYEVATSPFSMAHDATSGLPPHLQQYADGMNLYQYVGGNPVIYLDPSGCGRVTDILKKLAFGQLCRLAGCLAATKGIDIVCDIYLDDEAWLQCVCENMRDRLGFKILCFGYRTHLMNAFHCSDIGINP